jgi:hypothetical protein
MMYAWSSSQDSEGGAEHPEAAQGIGVQAIAHAGTIDFALDEACILQYSQVLRDSGLGETNLFNDRAAHAFCALGQHAQDAHSCGVAQRLGVGRKFLFKSLAACGDWTIGWQRGGTAWRR